MFGALEGGVAIMAHLAVCLAVAGGIAASLPNVLRRPALHASTSRFSFVLQSGPAMILSLTRPFVIGSSLKQASKRSSRVESSRAKGHNGFAYSKR
jgi:hypothetical protein